MKMWRRSVVTQAMVYGCLVLVCQSGCVFPSMRVGAGVSVLQHAPVYSKINPPPSTSVSSPESSRVWTPGFALDVLGGFQIFQPGSVWGVTTELGYSLDSQLFPAKFLAGVGVFLKVPLLGDVGRVIDFVTPTGMFGIGYHFHVVVAGHPESLRAGIRNTLYLHALLSMITLEFQYEYYPGDALTSMHNVRGMIGINLMSVLLFAMSRGRKRSPTVPPPRRK